MTRFVFLDRDGTLTRDEGYTHRVEDFSLLPNVVKGLRALAELGFHFAIITNQSGIGRGLYTESDYLCFQDHLHNALAEEGIEIDASYFCPHQPDENCSCRKPRAELLLRAAHELGADLSQSWMIGDREADLEAARAAGCCGSILLTAEPHEAPPGTLCARNILEAAELVKSAKRIDFPSRELDKC